MSTKATQTNKINRQLQHTPVAIIGMGSIFPQSKNLQEYWEKIIGKVDCITDVPPSRWSLEEYYDPNPKAPDKTYCKRGGFIPEIDFNPMEFGIPPNVLEVTDVSQLLGLVVAKTTMEDAGYGESRQFARDRVGVILGVALARQLTMPLGARLQYPIWEKALKSTGLSDEDTHKIIEKIKSAYVQWEENAFPGMLANIVAGRIANRLNLGGMNCVVDAACASSLGALAMAISELIEYRSDMMLTGGVDTDNSLITYMCFSKTPAVSPSENTKPFDADSDGMMLAEGIGMLLLKRLEDAERDNDRIYAVIKGIGSSSDGRYKSIYAPRPEGQAKAMRRAYEDAGFEAASVGLIEAHGTGTMVGDPSEVASLKEVFGENNPKKQYIALGSVKSQIGHTKAAAGAASLIKTALALHHKVLPPTINITKPHPKLNIENSPFYLNTQTRPWICAAGEAPRRAGISSFGFGGTNYHVVLEEYQKEHNRPYRLHNIAQPILIYASTPEQLLSRCEHILGELQSEAREQNYTNLVTASKDAAIPNKDARLGFVVNSLAEACQLLQISIDGIKNKLQAESWDHPQGIYYRKTGIATKGKVVALFSGQGSQYLEMGRELVINFPDLREVYGRINSLFCQDGLQPVSETVFPAPVFDQTQKKAQVKALQNTKYAQPAIGAFSAGLYKILQQVGFKPDFLAGHSFGELTALWAAGVFNDEDYFSLIKARGEAMSAPNDPQFDAGTMLAVTGEIDRVEELVKNFPQVTIANFNSKHQLVLAGAKAEIAKAQEALQVQGFSTVLLPVSAAFHTPLVGHAQKPFAQAIEPIHFQTPKIPIYTNVTGKLYPNEPSAIKRILKEHLINPVLFKREIDNIYAEGGYCFIEFGPKNVLTKLVKDILSDKPHLAVALNPSGHKDSDRQFREAVIQLRVAGLALKDPDPYQIEHKIPKVSQRKGLTVQLNGSNYVSQKTKQAFEKALQNGHQVKLNTKADMVIPTAQSSEPQSLLTPDSNNNGNGSNDRSDSNGHNGSHVVDDVKTHREEVQLAPIINSNQTAKKSHPISMNSSQDNPEQVLNYQQVLDSLEYTLIQFNRYQRDSLHVHEQSLKQQTEYTTTFFQLMQQQNLLLANAKLVDRNPQTYSPIKTTCERSMMRFHDHQTETLRIHGEYLKHQGEYTRNFFQLLQQQYEQLINGNSTKDNVVLQPQTTSIIKDYNNSVFARDGSISMSTNEHRSSPVPVSRNGASNGNNGSSNGVTAVQHTSASATSVLSRESHSDVSYGSDKVISDDKLQYTDTNGEKKNNAQLTDLTPIVAPSLPVAINIDEATLSQTLLTIVSDKTGYPGEMLELSMDIEADLGIDSIKRVEILGALLEQYPDFPRPNPEELAELRTLGQIVEYIRTLVTEVSEVPTSNNDSDDSTVTTSESSNPDFDLSTASLNSPKSALTNDLTDFAQVSQILLNIVSDKTGYPAEMLELSMDIEADLGIDSIKRVEILGALLEQYPDFPRPNSEEVAELRTLGQIVEYIQQQIDVAGKKTPQIKTQPGNEALVTGEGNNTQLEKNTPTDGLFQRFHINDSADPGDNLKSQIQNGIIFRNPVRLKYLPEPDILDFTLPDKHIALLTDDGTPTTTKLAETLIGQSWKTVVLSFPQTSDIQQSPLPEEVSRVVLADWSEEHLQEQLTSIASKYGPIAVFIHLNPANHDNTSNCVRYLESEKALLRHVFLIAKYLKEPLNQAAHQGRSCFLTVAHLDGKFGLSQKTNFGAISGGLFGLSKTLNQEWEPVFCRAIDLSPDLDSEQSLQYILGEINDPNRRIQEVGYSLEGRTTLVAETETGENPIQNSKSLDAAESSPQVIANPKSQVFLVSGGAKGITAECVIKLAQHYQCKFILLGRSSFQPEPVWAKDCQNEAELKKRIMDNFAATGEKPTPMMVQKEFNAISSRRQIEKTLCAVEQAGGEAEYICVDVTDTITLQEKVAAAVERLGDVTGIIHGAGNLADKRIERKSQQDFEKVYAAKVKGLENLLQCVCPSQINHLVLFSSVAGLYGNAGQSDYAIANEILNKSAYLVKRNYPNCHVVAINWGPWDSGMVSPELKKAFAERNIETIPIEIGTQMLVNELEMGNKQTAQVVIGSPLTYRSDTLNPKLQTYRIQRQLKLAANPFLQDHVIANNPVLPATCAMAWMANSCEQLYPGYKFFSCQNYKVLKGIIFNGQQASNYTLDLKEIAKPDENTIEFDAKIWSNTSGKTRYHFSTQIILKREITTPPIYENLDLNYEPIIPREGKSFYQNGVKSLFHGNCFQGVKKVLNTNPEKLTVECFLSNIGERQQGQFPVQTYNPYIGDVLIHPLWIWMQHFHSCACLPSKIKEFEQFAKIPFGKTFYISCEVKSKTDAAIVADVITHDIEGNIYSRMREAKGTVLPKSMSNI